GQALADAQRGDGRPLARVMQSCKVSWSSATDVLGVLPLVKEGKEELATALEWWHDDLPFMITGPFVVADYVALRRDMSRLVGDTQSAERWGAIAKRMTEPFDDPTRLFALVA